MAKVIRDNDLGIGLKIDSNKLVIDVKDDSGLGFDGNQLTVDLDKLGQLLNGKVKVVSDDDGNILSVGSDKGAFVDADTIKSLVGEMVASATDGIDYNEISKTLLAHIKNLAVTDSKTIDFTLSDNDGNETITGDVILSQDDNNELQIKDDGLYSPKLPDFIDSDTIKFIKATDVYGNVKTIGADIIIDPIDGNLLTTSSTGLKVLADDVKNIYTEDGKLKSNRTVDMDGKTLEFKGKGPYPTVTISGDSGNGGVLQVKGSMGGAQFYAVGNGWAIWNNSNGKDVLTYSKDTDTVALGNRSNGVRSNLWVKKNLRDYDGDAGIVGQVLTPRNSGNGTTEGVKWSDIKDVIDVVVDKSDANNPKLVIAGNEIPLEELQDLQGNTLGYLIKA